MRSIGCVKTVFAYYMHIVVVVIVLIVIHHNIKMIDSVELESLFSAVCN